MAGGKTGRQKAEKGYAWQVARISHEEHQTEWESNREKSRVDSQV